MGLCIGQLLSWVAWLLMGPFCKQVAEMLGLFMACPRLLYDDCACFCKGPKTIQKPD